MDPSAGADAAADPDLPCDALLPAASAQGAASADARSATSVPERIGVLMSSIELAVNVAMLCSICGLAQLLSCLKQRVAKLREFDRIKIRHRPVRHGISRPVK